MVSGHDEGLTSQLFVQHANSLLTRNALESRQWFERLDKIPATTLAPFLASVLSDTDDSSALALASNALERLVLRSATSLTPSDTESLRSLLITSLFSSSRRAIPSRAHIGALSRTLMLLIKLSAIANPAAGVHAVDVLAAQLVLSPSASLDGRPAPVSETPECPVSAAPFSEALRDVQVALAEAFSEVFSCTDEALARRSLGLPTASHMAACAIVVPRLAPRLIIACLSIASRDPQPLTVARSLRVLAALLSTAVGGDPQAELKEASVEVSNPSVAAALRPLLFVAATAVRYGFPADSTPWGTFDPAAADVVAAGGEVLSVAIACRPTVAAAAAVKAAEDANGSEGDSGADTVAAATLAYSNAALGAALNLERLGSSERPGRNDAVDSPPLVSPPRGLAFTSGAAVCDASPSPRAPPTLTDGVVRPQGAAIAAVVRLASALGAELGRAVDSSVTSDGGEGLWRVMGLAGRSTPAEFAQWTRSGLGSSASVGQRLGVGDPLLLARFDAVASALARLPRVASVADVLSCGAFGPSGFSNTLNAMSVEVAVGDTLFRLPPLVAGLIQFSTAVVSLSAVLDTATARAAAMGVSHTAVGIDLSTEAERAREISLNVMSFWRALAGGVDEAIRALQSGQGTVGDTHGGGGGLVSAVSSCGVDTLAHTPLFGPDDDGEGAVVARARAAGWAVAARFVQLRTSHSVFPPTPDALSQYLEASGVSARAGSLLLRPCQLGSADAAEAVDGALDGHEEEYDESTFEAVGFLCRLNAAAAAPALLTALDRSAAALVAAAHETMGVEDAVHDSVMACVWLASAFLADEASSSSLIPRAIVACLAHAHGCGVAPCATCPPMGDAAALGTYLSPAEAAGVPVLALIERVCQVGDLIVHLSAGAPAAPHPWAVAPGGPALGSGGGAVGVLAAPRAAAGASRSIPLYSPLVHERVLLFYARLAVAYVAPRLNDYSVACRSIAVYFTSNVSEAAGFSRCVERYACEQAVASCLSVPHEANVAVAAAQAIRALSQGRPFSPAVQMVRDRWDEVLHLPLAPPKVLRVTRDLGYSQAARREAATTPPRFPDEPLGLGCCIARIFEHAKAAAAVASADRPDTIHRVAMWVLRAAGIAEASFGEVQEVTPIVAQHADFLCNVVRIAATLCDRVAAPRSPPRRGAPAGGDDAVTAPTGGGDVVVAAARLVGALLPGLSLIDSAPEQEVAALSKLALEVAHATRSLGAAPAGTEGDGGSAVVLSMVREVACLRLSTPALRTLQAVVLGCFLAALATSVGAGEWECASDADRARQVAKAFQEQSGDSLLSQCARLDRPAAAQRLFEVLVQFGRSGRVALSLAPASSAAVDCATAAGVTVTGLPLGLLVDSARGVPSSFLTENNIRSISACCCGMVVGGLRSPLASVRAAAWRAGAALLDVVQNELSVEAVPAVAAVAHGVVESLAVGDAPSGESAAVAVALDALIRLAGPDQLLKTALELCGSHVGAQLIEKAMTTYIQNSVNTPAPPSVGSTWSGVRLPSAMTFESPHADAAGELMRQCTLARIPASVS